MWIKISKDTFENADFKSLNYLYQILTWFPSSSDKPRYNILVNTETVEETENFQKLSQIEVSLKDFLDDEFSYFVTSSKSTLPNYKVSYSRDNDQFDIEEAIVFFNQPVSIVLENNKNDSQFILAIISHFGVINDVNNAIGHFKNGWLQFENAGGCSNIPNFVEAFLQKFEKLAERKQRQVADYFRGLIIIDSDKEFGTQTSKHLNLLKKLQDLGLDLSQIHILEKRMMENYLPKAVYVEIRRQSSINHQSNESIKNWLDAYLSLIDDFQFDYINIHKGNLLGNLNPPHPELINLWNISGANFSKLNVGFNFNGFDSYGNLKKENNFKDEFPNLFRKQIVNKQNLEHRDGKGELQEIANKINDLL